MLEGKNILLDKIPYFELFIIICSGKANYPSKIAFLTGKKQSTIAEQMENLEKDGVLEKIMDGKYATYFIVWDRVLDLANFAIERYIKFLKSVDNDESFEQISIPNSELAEKSIKEVDQNERSLLDIWKKIKVDRTFRSMMRNSIEIFCKEWLEKNKPEEIDETFSREIIEIFEFILEYASKLKYQSTNTSTMIPKGLSKLLENLNLIYCNLKGLILEKSVAYMAMKKSFGEYLAEEVFDLDKYENL